MTSHLCCRSFKNPYKFKNVTIANGADNWMGYKTNYFKTEEHKKILNYYAFKCGTADPMLLSLQHYQQYFTILSMNLTITKFTTHGEGKVKKRGLKIF